MYWVKVLVLGKYNLGLNFLYSTFVVVLKKSYYGPASKIDDLIFCVYYLANKL